VVTATVFDDTPGVFDMDDATYLADPVPEGSLSASGAKLLVDCPAKFQHGRTAGETNTDYFDFGRAAHAMLLGNGAGIAVLDFDDRRTKAYKEAEAEARADGRTPLLRSTHDQAVAMVNAVTANPAARALMDLDGPIEQTFIWHDLCWRRAKLDKHSEMSDGRPIVIDFKTTTDASTGGFTKSSANYAYFQQDPWYRDAIRAVLGHPDPAFVFIVTEKEAPYLTAVYELVDSYRRIGEHRNEIAVARFLHGQQTGEWPGYSTDVERIAAPRWLEIEHEERLEREAEGDLAA
jgi:hypothetical protein